MILNFPKPVIQIYSFTGIKGKVLAITPSSEAPSPRTVLILEKEMLLLAQTDHQL